MRRFFWPAFLLCLATAAGMSVAPNAGAQRRYSHLGTLAGRVLNASGKPVAGARVTIQAADGTSPNATLTNSRGQFFFPYLYHSLYDVRAYWHGEWSDWKHNVTVRTGKQTNIELRLQPKRRSKRLATKSKSTGT